MRSIKIVLVILSGGGYEWWLPAGYRPYLSGGCVVGHRSGLRVDMGNLLRGIRRGNGGWCSTLNRST